MTLEERRLKVLEVLESLRTCEKILEDFVREQSPAEQRSVMALTHLETTQKSVRELLRV